MCCQATTDIINTIQCPYSSADVQLGSADFSGCVSLVQVWGDALDDAHINRTFVAKGDNRAVDTLTHDLRNALLLDWGWGMYDVGPYAQEVCILLHCTFCVCVLPNWIAICHTLR